MISSATSTVIPSEIEVIRNSLDQCNIVAIISNGGYLGIFQRSLSSSIGMNFKDALEGKPVQEQVVVPFKNRHYHVLTVDCSYLQGDFASLFNAVKESGFVVLEKKSTVREDIINSRYIESHKCIIFD